MYHLVFMTVHSINHLDTLSTKTGFFFQNSQKNLHFHLQNLSLMLHNSKEIFQNSI